MAPSRRSLATRSTPAPRPRSQGVQAGPAEAPSPPWASALPGTGPWRASTATVGTQTGPSAVQPGAGLPALLPSPGALPLFTGPLPGSSRVRPLSRVSPSGLSVGSRAMASEETQEADSSRPGTVHEAHSEESEEGTSGRK